jgi:hypothetical protein
MLALGLLPGAASAATQSVTPTFSGSGNNTDIVSLIAVCDECGPDAFFSGPFNTWGLGIQATLQAQANWSNPSTIDMDYTAGKVRHGQTLDLADTLTTGAGDCTKTRSFTLWNAGIDPFASAEVDLLLTQTVTVTGSGVQSLRIAVIDAGPSIPNQTLTFGGSSPSTVADPIAISCSQPIGNNLVYSLTNNSYTAEPGTYTGELHLHLQGNLFGIPVASYDTPSLFSTSGADLGPIDMSALDQQVDLGPVLANNVAPTADAGGPYSGVEGTPITFNGTGSTSVCGFGSLTWSGTSRTAGLLTAACRSTPSRHRGRSPG